MKQDLSALAPAPASWIARACELPQIARACGLLQARSARQAAGDSRREAHAALRAVGLEPDDRRVRTLERMCRSAMERR